MHLKTLARALVVSTTWAAAGLAWTPEAPAQLDVRGLIGHAVSDDASGSRYPDVQQAITRFRNRDFDGARQYLIMAKEKHSELPPPDVSLAKLHFAANQSATGQAALEQAVSQYPDDPEAYLILAELSLREGRATAAEMLFSRAATANESIADTEKRKRHYVIRAFNGLTAIAERREDWAAAGKHLRAWVKADPESANPWYRLGRTLFMAGDPDNARKAFERAKSLDANLPHPDIALGRLYHQQGKPAEARKSMEQAIAADGNSASTRLAYGQWLLEIDDPAGAKEHLQAALQIDPSSLNALLLSGVQARVAQDYEAAEGYLGKAHLLAPRNATITNQLALVLLAQDDQAQQRRAVEFAELGARQDPNNGDLQATLGLVYFQLGRTREAHQALNEAVKRRNLSADSRFMLARILVDQGRNEPAVQILEPALQASGIFVNRKEAQALLDQIRQ
jgi:tetratricopeptide (TPR) repeat protein